MKKIHILLTTLITTVTIFGVFVQHYEENRGVPELNKDVFHVTIFDAYTRLLIHPAPGSNPPPSSIVYRLNYEMFDQYKTIPPDKLPETPPIPIIPENRYIWKAMIEHAYNDATYMEKILPNTIEQTHTMTTELPWCSINAKYLETFYDAMWQKMKKLYPNAPSVKRYYNASHKRKFSTVPPLNPQ